MKKKISLWQRVTQLFADSSPLMRLVERTALLVLLNLLWLLCCVPLVTVGASCAALDDCLAELPRLSYASVFSRFFCAFRRFFLRATALWAAAAGLGYLIYRAFLLAAQNALTDSPRAFPLYLSAAVCILFASGLFPALAIRGEGIPGTMRLSLLNGLADLGRSLCAAALAAAPAVMLILQTRLFVRLRLFWILLGPALIEWARLQLLLPVFSPRTSI